MQQGAALLRVAQFNLGCQPQRGQFWLLTLGQMAHLCLKLLRQAQQKAKAGVLRAAPPHADMTNQAWSQPVRARPGLVESLQNAAHAPRSEEHTSELQSHSFISYAVF